MVLILEKMVTTISAQAEQEYQIEVEKAKKEA